MKVHAWTALALSMSASLAHAVVLVGATVAAANSHGLGGQARSVNLPATFTFRMTNKLEAGTTATDVLCAGGSAFGATPACLDIGIGLLALAAGKDAPLTANMLKVSRLAPVSRNLLRNEASRRSIRQRHRMHPNLASCAAWSGEAMFRQ